MDKLEVNKVYYHTQVARQRQKAFELNYHFCPSMIFHIEEVVEKVASGSMTNWEALSYCINNKLPVMVKPKDHVFSYIGENWNEPIGGLRCFIIAGIDDLKNDRRDVLTQAYGRKPGSLWIIPVDCLTVDLSFNYRSLIDSEIDYGNQERTNINNNGANNEQ